MLIWPKEPIYDVMFMSSFEKPYFVKVDKYPIKSIRHHPGFNDPEYYHHMVITKVLTIFEICAN